MCWICRGDVMLKAARRASVQLDGASADQGGVVNRRKSQQEGAIHVHQPARTRGKFLSAFAVATSADPANSLPSQYSRKNKLSTYDF